MPKDERLFHLDTIISAVTGNVRRPLPGIATKEMPEMEKHLRKKINLPENRLLNASMQKYGTGCTIKAWLLKSYPALQENIDKALAESELRDSHKINASNASDFLLLARGHLQSFDTHASDRSLVEPVDPGFVHALLDKLQQDSRPKPGTRGPDEAPFSLAVIFSAALNHKLAPGVTAEMPLMTKHLMKNIPVPYDSRHPWARADDSAAIVMFGLIHAYPEIIQSYNMALEELPDRNPKELRASLLPLMVKHFKTLTNDSRSFRHLKSFDGGMLTPEMNNELQKQALELKKADLEEMTVPQVDWLGRLQKARAQRKAEPPSFQDFEDRIFARNIQRDIYIICMESGIAVKSLSKTPVTGVLGIEIDPSDIAPLSKALANAGIGDYLGSETDKKSGKTFLTVDIAVIEDSTQVMIELSRYKNTLAKDNER